MNILLQTLHNLDTSAFMWVNVKHRCQYRRTIKAISKTGDGHLYIAVGVTLLLFGGEVGRAFFFATLLAYGFDVSLYLLIKNTIKRDRPTERLDFYDAWVTPSDKFSFPSGHTAAAFVFAAMVLNFYPLYAPLLLGWAALVGISRVLLGVHYPSDIVAGMVLGLGSAYCALEWAPPWFGI